MSFHTIKDGEQALIFNRGGSGRVVVGPRRVRARECVCGKGGGLGINSRATSMLLSRVCV